jgi:hypothetical protein
MSDQPQKKAKKGRAITHILAIDVETSGGNVLKHWMPEVAGAFWRIGDHKPLATFYRCLAQPLDTEWSEGTLAQFWNNPEKGFDGKTPLQALHERQAAHAPLADPIQAMHDFVAWARALEAAKADDDEEIMIVTDTTGFDAAWLAVYLARAGYDGPETLFGQWRSKRSASRSCRRGCCNMRTTTTRSPTPTRSPPWLRSFWQRLIQRPAPKIEKTHSCGSEFHTIIFLAQSLDRKLRYTEGAMCAGRFLPACKNASILQTF